MFEKIEDYFRNFKTLPVFPNQKQWKEVFASMTVHTRGAKPEELLLKRRPNEEPVIHQYRLDNYEPITYGSMNKAMDDLFRIVSAINYTIKAPDDFQKWLAETKFTGYGCDAQNEQLTLDLFLQKVVLKRMIEDPNGFLVWLPTGEGLTNDAVPVEVKPKLIYSSQFKYSDESVFIYKSDEVTPLKDNDGNMVLVGEVYNFFTKTEFWKMFQVGTVAEPKWKQEMVYAHGLGAFPVIVLGGDITSDNYYNSFFAPYLAFGNEAIRQYSDWQAVMTTSTFPFIEEFAQECTFRVVEKQTEDSGKKGKENFKKEVKLVPMSKSPHNILYRKIPTGNLNQDVLPVEIPSRRYISPDISVAKYSGEAWQLLIEKAEQALNIDLTVGVEQSGAAKKLDKEAQYSMITKIGNNFFDNIYTNSLQIIYAYINAQPIDNTVSIIKPSTFWVKNEDDLVAEISTLKEKNVPSFFLAEATLDLAKKRFSGNKVSEKIFQVIALYDPLYIYTIDEKNTLLAGSVIQKSDYVKSIYMFGILNQIAMKKGAEPFLNMDAEAIKLEFDALVLPFIPVEKAPIMIENFPPNG